jgi:aconitate hydratase
VTDYLRKAGLLKDLEALGFYTVGYGCTTYRQLRPLKPEISEAVRSADVVACSVLSGNRNFEGRVHPEIK